MKPQKAKGLETDIIPCAEARSLPGLFAARIRRTPDSPAYRQFDMESGEWRSYTWQETAALVRRWKQALAEENLDPGERVAVLLGNSLEWVCFDQAALALGLVVVPLYPSDTPHNIAFILGDSGARLLLVGTQRRWETLAPLFADGTPLGKVLCKRESEEPEDRSSGSSKKIIVEGVDDWLHRAGQQAEGQPGGQVDIDNALSIDPGALATLVYTSGTTGKPKGVMLSHQNILWNAEATLTAIPGYREDVYLSLLPLSHMFERTVGYYVPIMAGSSVAYARSLKNLPEDLDSVRPRILVAVPQVYEKIRDKVHQQVQEKGRVARTLFDWTIAIGWGRFESMQRRRNEADSRWWHRLAWPVLHRLVAKKILAHLGGELRLAVSGGGPLAAEVSRHFIAMGLPLVQGYGLTETSPVLTANRIEDNIAESVGRALPGVELKLGGQDELLVRSPGLMLGYWNRPEDTQAAIDQDGWFHTGDVARISNDHVFICGRIKEILVTSGGEKIPAGDLQMAITREPLFEQAMVVGEGRPHLAALIVMNQEEWEKFAADLGVQPNDPESLTNPTVKGKVMNRISEALRGFPKYARIRSVHLALEPWTVENGLLTPTMKLKRPEMEKCFADEITRLYNKHDARPEPK
ncbi:MAG: long-chain fatty acid--CoA ligase [Nitrosospira sp.]|nr:long-chain fatty acid--CoA ligase [Nitrosospira sp.]